MLSPEDLGIWYRRLGLSEASRSVIDQIRSAPPSRRVGGGRQNVSGRYPSRKMGVTIQFESHRVELAGIYEMEHDAGVLEYYDQPRRPVGKNGRRKRIWSGWSNITRIDTVAMHKAGGAVRPGKPKRAL